MVLNRYLPTININLSPGVYIFSNESATGKSRLCKELRKNQMYGERVASYSYEDFLLNRSLDSILASKDYDVIMLDRYDLYNGEGSSLIEKLKDTCVILIDCKSGLNFSVPYEFCFLNMDKDSLEVVE